MPNAQEVLDWIKWDKERKANMTNEEYIRTCSTEDLAVLIYQDRWAQSDGWYEQTGHTVEDVKKWLKEKHHA